MVQNYQSHCDGLIGYNFSNTPPNKIHLPKKKKNNNNSLMVGKLERFLPIKECFTYFISFL